MKKDFGIVFWIHLFLIAIIWLSPLWADWKLILIGIIALHIYWAVFRGCHLTKIEAGDDIDNTFYYYYLSKHIANLDKRKTKFFVRYVIPLIILALAYFLQEFYQWPPFYNF